VVGLAADELIRADVTAALASLQHLGLGRIAVEVTVVATARSTDAILYRSGPYICCELESLADDDGMLRLSALQFPTAVFESDHDPEALAVFACSLLHQVAGFERTYYCQFDATSGEGMVIGEHVSGSLPSLDGHRFPASDVPANVRPVYVRNRFRCIADAAATPIPLVTADGSPAPALDLTFAFARQPAATHIQYLTHMGVRASASFSVVQSGRLVGLFGGHAVVPRALRFRQLAACQLIVDAYANRLAVLEADRFQRSVDLRRSQVGAVCASLQAANHRIVDLVRTSKDLLCQVIDAEGLIVCSEGEICSTLTLDTETIGRLVAAIAGKVSAEPVWSTDRITTLDPTFSSIAPQVAGVLAIGLASRELLIWTRVERLRDTRWSGNPSQAVIVDQDGAVGPRRSFTTWVEQVTGTCDRWAPELVGIARLLREDLNRQLTLHLQETAIAATRRADECKSQFLANVTHELRTPMHSILGFTEVLVDSLGDLSIERQRTLLGFVTSSSRRLLDLVNDLLDLSKLEANRMDFHIEDDSILDAIDSAIVDANAALAGKQIPVTVEAGEIDPIVPIDRARSIQLFVNLLANAAHASPEGAPIHIRLRDVVSDGASCVQVEIADRGLGIPTDQLETVFDNFVQSTRLRGRPGSTGLGLPICRQIARSHGGRIWAGHNAHGGTSMFVEYPRSQVAS
jgi:two-component system, chemotaxis family, sensor kinase Cph1